MAMVGQAPRVDSCVFGNRAPRVATLLIFSLVLVCAGCGQSRKTVAPEHPTEVPSGTFQSASTVEETWRQHKALPDPAEKIWWDINGPDMLWNNKNIHQIVPIWQIPQAFHTERY